MNLLVQKRDGQLVPFDNQKIEDAINKAALEAGIAWRMKAGDLLHDIAGEITSRFYDNDFTPNVENIHDVVEKHLMHANLYDVAKSYILYRAEHRKRDFEERKKSSFFKKLGVKKSDDRLVTFSEKKVRDNIERCGAKLHIDKELVFSEATRYLFNGMVTTDISKALIMAATSFIELEPDYNYLAARFFQQMLRKEVFGVSTELGSEQANKHYRSSFIAGIKLGVKHEVFDPRLLEFDLKKLSLHLEINRDNLFKYIGLNTLYERYFAKVGQKRIETAQAFWMRVAMGLSILEELKEEKATEFYEGISQFLYMPSTPTLFHSGLTRPQLASCFLTSCSDDLHHIFKTFSDNAQLSKWSGGIGNDWTNVRSTGANIKSTAVESQGVIPFLKIANDTTVAINRSGKRRGATVAYLANWHLDYEDFLELRKNTGDERRRTHDMNTASWIPDIFMKRVKEKGRWTLFSPDEVPDLHSLYGSKFEVRYEFYEKEADAGRIKKFKVLEADKLYKKMIAAIFETGHPWFTFSCPSNIRSPQDHVGVVNSSNLCSEIILNTNEQEVAVCNLASINLSKFVVDGCLDFALLANTIRTAMRSLDNVIDLNFYPIPEARTSNIRHRPVGLGIMGFQDLLFAMNVNFEDSEDLVDELQEFIAYEAISASVDLAIERGAYETFAGSKWDRGIFPLDTLDLLEEERGIPIPIPRTMRLNWQELKDKVKKHGLRNSNTMAIAPTATISTIVGCLGPCIEPQYKNIFVESNMSGEFTVINEYLVKELRKLGLWDKSMMDQIKFHDGSIQKIKNIPEELKQKYKEVFEIDPKIPLRLTAVRGKWIDQSQSHNVFFAGNSGKALYDLYLYAWEAGLKTTYYLRTLGVSQIEKSTLDTKFGFTQKRETVKECKLNDPTCEACQ